MPKFQIKVSIIKTQSYQIRTEDSEDQISMPTIDQLGRTISESSKRLMRFMYKFAKSVKDTNSKVHEFLTYNETINDLVYRTRWREVINEKL